MCACVANMQASVGNLESSKAQLTDDLQEAHQTLKLRGMEFDRAKRELQEEMVERERQLQQRKKEEMAEYHRLHAEEVCSPCMPRNPCSLVPVVLFQSCNHRN